MVKSLVHFLRSLLAIFAVLLLSLRNSTPFTFKTQQKAVKNGLLMASSPSSATPSILPSLSTVRPSLSTVVKPKRKTKEGTTTEPSGPKSVPGIFKESRDILKEFEEYIENDENYILLLFNDPFNKRIYVATVLMQTFSFTEEVASDVMMQAHTNGFAVVGEWSKEVATDYCKQLVDKGLVAEVVKSPKENDSAGGAE